MVTLFWTELKTLGSFFRRHRREAGVIALACLLIILHEYNPLDKVWLNSLVYYGAAPLAAIAVFFRARYLDFGFRLGNWKVWGLHVLVTLVIAVPVLLISSRSESLQAYYTIEDFSLAWYSLEALAYLFGWEFLFRGFLLFGLREKLGEYAVLVQMIPFVLLHIGKPEIETISTIFMGIYFGYVAYRGNSYWPALIIHLAINIGFRAIVNL